MSEESKQYQPLYFESKEKYSNLYETWRDLQLECDEYKREVEKLKSQNEDLQMRNLALTEQTDLQPLLRLQVTSQSLALEDADEALMTDKALIANLRSDIEPLTLENMQLQQSLSALRDTEIERKMDADRAKQALHALQQKYDSLQTTLQEQTQQADKDRALALEMQNKVDSLQAEYDEQAFISANDAKSKRKETLRLGDIRSSNPPPHDQARKRTMRDSTADVFLSLGNLFDVNEREERGDNMMQFVQYDSANSLLESDDADTALPGNDGQYKFVIEELTDTGAGVDAKAHVQHDKANGDEHKIPMHMQLEELKQRLERRNEEIETMLQSQKTQKTELKHLLQTVEAKNTEIANLKALEAEVQQLRTYEQLRLETRNNKCSQQWFPWNCL